MTDTPPEPTANDRVTDEERTVDRLLKERIINVRKRVDEREDSIFVDPSANGQPRQSYGEKVAAWGIMVRQYLRAIEPLLSSDKVPEAEYYYKEIPLGYTTLTPPNTEHIPDEEVNVDIAFDEYSSGNMSEVEFRLRSDLPDHAELPESKPIEFNGLRSIIEHESIVEESWVVDTGRENDGVIEISASKPVPKSVYEAALRNADKFLQAAGIAIETGARKQDDRDEIPF